MVQVLNIRDTGQRHIDGAVLDPKGAASTIRVLRYRPSPALQPWVRHFWFVRWDLRGEPDRNQQVLPLPAVNAVIEGDRARIYGPQTRRFDKVLAGQGAAFGTLFLPAAFQPFWNRSMHLLVDQTLAFDAVFGDAGADLVELAAPWVASAANDATIQQALEAFLLKRLPPWTPARRVSDWVAQAESDRSITRAEVLATRCGVTLRTLQRELRRAVGLGPKPLIRRYRLLEAAGQIVRGEAVDHTRLALELGYNDQSHFVRDFRAVVGQTPGAYARGQGGAALRGRLP